MTALLNANQLLVGLYQYDSFGRTLSISGPKSGLNPYRFSSKPIHTSSGNYDFLYRWYVTDPPRWLTRDPIGEVGGVNLYQFVGNSPIDNTDPLGLDFSLWIGGGAGYSNFKLHVPPSDPVVAATSHVGSFQYNIFNPFQPPKWIGKTKCDKFIGDCISQCPNRPKPLVNGRYPTASEWADPNVTIPGYGPPHTGPKPGDVVTDGNHLGFMTEDGYLEASTFGSVKLLPINNPLWNPGIGRSPLH